MPNWSAPKSLNERLNLQANRQLQVTWVRSLLPVPASTSSKITNIVAASLKNWSKPKRYQVSNPPTHIIQTNYSSASRVHVEIGVHGQACQRRWLDVHGNHGAGVRWARDGVQRIGRNGQGAIR